MRIQRGDCPSDKRQAAIWRPASIEYPIYTDLDIVGSAIMQIARRRVNSGPCRATSPLAPSALHCGQADPSNYPDQPKHRLDGRQKAKSSGHRGSSGRRAVLSSGADSSKCPSGHRGNFKRVLTCAPPRARPTSAGGPQFRSATRRAINRRAHRAPAVDRGIVANAGRRSRDPVRRFRVRPAV